MNERTYRSSQVLKLTGVTRRQLQHWRSQGIVTASESSRGGAHPRYTERDIRRVRILLALLSSDKISLRRAASVIDSLHLEVEKMRDERGTS